MRMGDTTLESPAVLADLDNTFERNISDSDDSDIQNTQPLDQRVLKDVVAYVEVRSNTENRSRAIERELRQLGAVVERKFSNDITHVIFKDGRKSTRDKATKRGIHLVNVLWVDSCKQNQEHVSERLYPVTMPDEAHTPIMLARLKKSKSMQPKDFDEEVANSAERGEKKRRRIANAEKKKRLSVTPLTLNPRVLVEETQPRSPDAYSVLKETDGGSFSSMISIPDTPPSMREKLNSLRKAREEANKASTEGSSRLSNSPVCSQEISLPLERRLFDKRNLSLNTSSESDDSVNMLEVRKTGSKCETISPKRLNNELLAKENNSPSPLSVPKRKNIQQKRKLFNLESNYQPPENLVMPTKTSNKMSLLNRSKNEGDLMSEHAEEDRSVKTGKRNTTSRKRKSFASSKECDNDEENMPNQKQRKVDKKDSEKSVSVKRVSDRETSKDSDETNNHSTSSANHLSSKPNARRKSVIGTSDCPLSEKKTAKQRRQSVACTPNSNRYSDERSVCSGQKTKLQPETENTSKSAPRRRRSCVAKNTIVDESNSASNVTVCEKVVSKRNVSSLSESHSLSFGHVSERRKPKTSKVSSLQEGVSDESAAKSLGNSNSIEKMTKPGTRRRQSCAVAGMVNGSTSNNDISNNRNLNNRRRSCAVGGGDVSGVLGENVDKPSSKPENNNYVSGDLRGKSTAADSSLDRREVSEKLQLHVSFSDSDLSDDENTMSTAYSPKKDSTQVSAIISNLCKSRRETAEFAPLQSNKSKKSTKKSVSVKKNPSSSDVDESTSSKKKMLSKKSPAQKSRHSSASDNDGVSIKFGRKPAGWKKVVIVSPRGEQKPKRSLVMTSLHFDEQDIVLSVVKKLGGFSVCDSVVESTSHVICGNDRRTLNVLHAIVRGCWVVSLDWIMKSLETSKWVDEEPYELSDSFPAAQESRLERFALGGEYKQDLFSDVGLIYIAESTSPPHEQMVSLVKLCSGRVTLCARKANICVGIMKPDVTSVMEKWVLDSITHHCLLSVDNYLLGGCSDEMNPSSPQY